MFACTHISVPMCILIRTHVSRTPSTTCVFTAILYHTLATIRPVSFSFKTAQGGTTSLECQLSTANGSTSAPGTEAWSDCGGGSAEYANVPDGAYLFQVRIKGIQLLLYPGPACSQWCWYWWSFSVDLVVHGGAYFGGFVAGLLRVRLYLRAY